MYYSNRKIIKYVVGFEPIHCAINLNTMSSSKVLNEFDYLFICNLLLV